MSKTQHTPYKRALAAPARSGVGWAHANRESTQAAAAQAIGAVCCLRPEALFDWATRHGIYLLHDLTADDKAALGPLLLAVLNDWGIEEARAA